MASARDAKRAVLSRLLDAFVSLEELVDEVIDGGYIAADETTPHRGTADRARIERAAAEVMAELERRTRG